METAILRRIENYLRETDTPPTRFGRESVNDPRLVFDIRRGRELRRRTERKVAEFLDLMGAA